MKQTKSQVEEQSLLVLQKRPKNHLGSDLVRKKDRRELRPQDLDQQKTTNQSSHGKVSIGLEQEKILVIDIHRRGGKQEVED